MRDKSKDDIFLRNFFEYRISFFTGTQPVTQESYLHGYDEATSSWYPLKHEIDDYPTLSVGIKKDLHKLFELAETYFYLSRDDKKFRSPEMYQRWEEIRSIARTIYSSARAAGLLNPSSIIVL